MMTPLRRLIGTVAASVMLVVGAGLPAQAQVEQDGLVNIAIGDVTILEDVNVAVAANIAAQVCGIVVNVGVIQEIDAEGGTFECDFRRGPQDITITQNT
jgi:hypothetical protein